MKRFSVLHALIVVLLLISLSACTSGVTEQTAVLPNDDLLSKTSDQTEPALIEGEIEKEELNLPSSSIHEDVSQTDAPFSGFNDQIFIDIYNTVNPSVVNIQVMANPDVAEDGDEAVPPLPELPDEFPGFPNFSFPNIPLQPTPREAQGSGFIYDRAGHIITNNHVVAGADEIRVTFADGSESTATLVGTDPDTDLAVIKVDEVDREQLVPVVLGDSSALQVGQFVVAIGNPFGLQGSMTTGIISGLGRILPAGVSQFSIPDIIQTDAAINPGNSGGPLLNLNGEVIGVNTAIQSPSRAFAGIGYAVPVDTVREVVPALISDGRIQHPWLGIAVADETLTSDIAAAMNLDPDQRGVLIADVIIDSPAHEAGLRGSDTQTNIDGQPTRIGGDVIVGIDERTIVDFDDLLSYIVHETDIGQTVTLHILRDGEPLDIEVTLAPRPENNNK